MHKRAPLLWLLVFLLHLQFALAQEPSPNTPAGEVKKTPAPPAPQYPLAAWKPLIAKEGNFSIAFPVAVKGETARFQLQDGSGVESRFTVPTSDGNYQAAITFLSDNIATPELVRARFTSLLKGLQQNPRIKWISGGDISLEGNPGIEFKVFLNETKIITWSRQYFAFGCVYETTARYLAREPEAQEPQLFLHSFKLLGPPLQRPSFSLTTHQSPPNFTPLAQNMYYVSPEQLRAHALDQPEPKFETEGKVYGGTITLLLTVSPAGKVLQADPADGFMGFSKEATKAAKNWTFKPFLLNGKPVKVQGRLTFKFGRATIP